MGRIINVTLNLAGFPRSGNHYLHQVLINSFPNEKIKEYIGNASALDLKDCLVPIRNPYNSVPSWKIFYNEQDLEGIASWNFRFLSKVLKNIDNLYVIDFLNLIKDTNSVSEAIANHFSIKKFEIDLTKLDTNANAFPYEPYNSPMMENCFAVYEEILRKI